MVFLCFILLCECVARTYTCTFINLFINLFIHSSIYSSIFNFVGYVKEVNDWLNSTECSDVFQRLKSKLIKVIQEGVNTKNSTFEDNTVYVYLAADNQQVKEAFEESIINDENNSNYNFSLKVMTVDTKFVQHIKDLTKFKAVTNNEGTYMQLQTNL